jgi:hypothetical protein
MKQLAELETDQDWFDYLTEMAEDLRQRLSDGPQFKGNMKAYELDHTQLKNWYQAEHELLDVVLKCRLRYEARLRNA